MYIIGFLMCNDRVFKTLSRRDIHKIDHRFTNLAELLNGDLAAKIGRGIFSRDLMDRKCNCSLPSKVNVKYVYKGKCRSRCIIYKVK